MAHYQVYISSTFRDLAAYRQTVMNTLQAVPNFSVTGMEYYVAQNLQPLEKCLEDVAKCDIYLLILANRYGYVRPGDTDSITRHEYKKAIELKKIILVFKADTQGGSFAPDTDAEGQPSAAQKAKWLAEFIIEASEKYVSHPKGFTSEYHLALQVMEALVRNQRVEYDGDELSEECGMFCDRTLAVSDFYRMAKRKQPFNVFLIPGEKPNLPDSLVERLCKFNLNVSPTSLLQVNYYDLMPEGLYSSFQERVLDHIYANVRLSGLVQATDLASILQAMKTAGTTTLTLWSSVTNALQWERGYDLLNQLFGEFKASCAAVDDFRVYWFLIIDKPDTLLKQNFPVSITATSALAPVAPPDVEQWVREHVIYKGKRITSLVLYTVQQLFFPETEDLPMYQAQANILNFTQRYNNRRRDPGEAELLKLLP